MKEKIKLEELEECNHSEMKLPMHRDAANYMVYRNVLNVCGSKHH